MSDTHPCTDFAQPVGRIWATDNNRQACPLLLLTEEKPMTEDCVLHSLVCVATPLAFCTCEIQTGFLANVQAWVLDQQERAVQSPGPFWSVS